MICIFKHLLFFIFFLFFFLFFFKLKFNFSLHSYQKSVFKMTDYEYSPSCSPTYIREKATLWIDEWDPSEGWDAVCNVKREISRESTNDESINNDKKDEYIQEKATLWHDEWDPHNGWTKKYISHFKREISRESTNNESINNDKKDEYIQQLEEKIVNQQKQINKQEGTIKQLTDVYCEMNTTLTRLWNKSFNINMANTREEIKEILNIWYQKEWMSVL